MRTRTNHSPDGFTLVELTVVVLIAGIILAMTAVAFSSYAQRAAARGAAQTFSADLRLARNYALRAREAVRIEFVEDSSSYRVVVTSGDTLSARYFRSDRGDFRIDSLRLQVTGDTLHFDADGELDSSVLSSGTATALFSAGGTTYQVQFNATGASAITLQSS